MNTQIIIHNQAKETFDNLPEDEANRIHNKLEEMSSNEFRRLGDYDVERVQSVTAPVMRARIGDWRVFFTSQQNRLVILSLSDRDGAYHSAQKVQQRAKDYAL